MRYLLLLMLICLVGAAEIQLPEGECIQAVVSGRESYVFPTSGNISIISGGLEVKSAWIDPQVEMPAAAGYHWGDGAAQ